MLFFLLVLPALAHARLGIIIDVSSRQDDVHIDLLGEDDHIIDDQEIREFRLTDAPLKGACERYDGAWPTDAYLKSPTPWGDLYQRYGWTQVHRKLKPIRATILGIHSEPTIIATQKFRNNSTKTAQYKADLTQTVTNTATNSWNLAHTINVGQDISYEFIIPVGKVGGKTSIQYSHQWAKSGSESQSVTVGASAGVTVPVAPGETVEASMSAARGTMEVEVVYEATVYGYVAANYESGHLGHWFWAYDINAVMAAGNMPRQLQVTEVIKVGFYTDVEIVLHDKMGKKQVLVADITF